MTLPAIGFVGLVFLFLFLVVGILLLVLLTKHDLRHRLCEALASYRSPAKTEKSPRLRERRKKRKHNSYTPHIVPGPTQLLKQMEEDETDRTLAQVSKAVRSDSFSKNQRSNSLTKLRDNGRLGHKPPTTSPAYSNNPTQQFAYPGAPLKSSHLSDSKDLLGNVFYPTSGPTSLSSGTSTPQDGSEKKGILKHSSSAGYKNSGYSSKHKSVGYQDEVQTLEISMSCDP